MIQSSRWSKEDEEKVGPVDGLEYKYRGKEGV